MLAAKKTKKTHDNIITNNCAPLRKSSIEYYAMLVKVGVHHYNENNIDLANITKIVGDSNIIKTMLTKQ